MIEFLKNLLKDISVFEIILFTTILYFIISGKLSSLLARTKKLKAGHVELDLSGMDEHTKTLFKKLWERFDTLQEAVTQNRTDINQSLNTIQRKFELQAMEFNALTEKVNYMSIDVLKLMFYSGADAEGKIKGVNDEDKLIGGLRYVYEGYDHQMRIDVIDYAIKNPVLYRGITRSTPKFKIDEVEKILATK